MLCQTCFLCLCPMIILYPLCSWWFAYLTVDGVTCWFEETVDLKKLDVFIIYTFPMGIIIDKPFKMMDIAYFVVTMKVMWWNDKSQNLTHLQIFCLCPMIILYPLCSWWFAYLTVDGVTCWFEETVDLKKLDVFIIYTFPMGIIIDKPFKMMDIAYFVVTMKVMWWNDKSQNLTHLQIFCLWKMAISQRTVQIVCKFQKLV